MASSMGCTLHEPALAVLLCFAALQATVITLEAHLSNNQQLDVPHPLVVAVEPAASAITGAVVLLGRRVAISKPLS